MSGERREALEHCLNKLVPAQRQLLDSLLSDDLGCEPLTALVDLVAEPADASHTEAIALTGATPDVSGVQTAAPERYECKGYWNTGEHDAKMNHWRHLTFTGLKDAELIGARIELTADGRKQYRWIHSNHSYKSGGQLDAQFGLGQATTANVTVTLPNGKFQRVTELNVNKTHALAWESQ